MKKVFVLMALVSSLSSFAQTAEEIIEKYIQSFGGRDAIAKVKDLKMTMTGEVQGASIEILMQKKVPNKSMQSVTVSGMGEMSRMVCNGTKAVTTAQGNTTNLEGAILKFSILEAGICPEANYKAAGVKMIVAGKEKVAGSDAHKIECELDGQKWSAFFDVATGLRTQMVVTQEGPMGQVTATMTYSDHKEVSGLKMAHKLLNDMGMFSLELDIKNEINIGIPDSEFEVQ